MTYEEFKEEIVADNFKRFNWDLSDDEVLKEIRTYINRFGDREIIRMTEMDKSLQTSVKDLVDALLQKGFPAEKITMVNENKAEIMLGKVPYTIVTMPTGHSMLFENNNSRNFMDFIHTPADLLASYLVERYCSDNWAEEEVQRRMIIFKGLQKRKKQEKELRDKFFTVMEKVKKAILESEDYEQHEQEFMSAFKEYQEFMTPDEKDVIINEQVAQEWEKIVEESVKEREEELKRQQKAKAASEHYEKVTKPKMQAKKQAVIEEKKVILREIKEKYGVECKFINVHSQFDPHHRFVVPAIEGQVVSFFDPEKFDRDFYDRAMKFVAYLNELTTEYGKTKVQTKGSLPKKTNEKLQKLKVKLNVFEYWQGIYNDSQRHYLDGTKYKEEVVL